MSTQKYWYLRSPRELSDAHLAEAPTAKYGAVDAVCGASFTPVAVFHYGSKNATTPPDPRVCADCQQAPEAAVAVAALPHPEDVLMPWYQQSRGFGDTHLGTVTRGRVHTDCGIAFRAAAALSTDPAPDQVCPECCRDYDAWLLLLRVAGGVLGQHGDGWYCHDEHHRPVFSIDADLVRTLHDEGLLGFTEPDESGKIEISLTPAGKARLSELDKRRSQTLRDPR